MSTTQHTCQGEKQCHLACPTSKAVGKQREAPTSSACLSAAVGSHTRAAVLLLIFCCCCCCLAAADILLLLLSAAVCRDPKVQDGPWSAIDRQLVSAAQRDAEQQQARISLAPPLPDSSAQQAVTQSSSSSTDPQAAAIDLKGFVLLGKTPEQLSAVAVQLGQPKYRGKQMLDSLLKGCRDVVELAGLPKAFKEQLSEAGQCV